MTMTGFIIDTYNPRSMRDRNCAISTFQVNNRWYAVKEVEIGLDGLPLIQQEIGQEFPLSIFKVYNSVEEAMKYIRRISLWK